MTPRADQLHALCTKRFPLPEEAEDLYLEEITQYRAILAEDGTPPVISIPPTSSDYCV